MRQAYTTAGPVEFSPEDAAMNDWLTEDSDYMRLEGLGTAVELQGAAGFDMDEPERN